MTTLWSISRRAALLLTMAALFWCGTTRTEAEALTATATDLTQVSAEAEMARDITADCLINGRAENKTMDQLRDGNYRTFWEGVLDKGTRQLIVTPPEGELAAGILIRWRSLPEPMAVQITVDGAWETVASCDNGYFTMYIPLPDIGEFRLIGRDNPQALLQICELTVMTAGRLPEDFQVWEAAPEKVDLLLLSAHPDDEVLWFGGLLPTYAGERGMKVLVECNAPNSYHRRIELLDSLWTCGVRIYPVFGGYEDWLTSTLEDMYKFWNKHSLQRDLTALYRQYKPDVVVLHDKNGEYGHGAHRALSDSGRAAVALAADETQFPESAQQYGVWDIPKVYVHLWAENQLTMDWHQPLARFGGLTAQQVARQAYACHISQQSKRWAVWDGGIWDNSLFGLFHTTVGPDIAKNDLFEHIQ